MTLMYMTTVCKLRNNENNTATAEEINTWTKEIAMRICQKHIGTEILENIHSLKRSVEKLSVSCLYYFLLLIIIATFLYVLYIASWYIAYTIITIFQSKLSIFICS
jgi:uncharacterized protein YacL